MNILILSILLLIHINHFGIQIYPSGIQVNFTAPEKPKKKEYLLQNPTEIEKKSLNTYRLIRVINSIPDIPTNEYIALIFYDKKGNNIGYYKIIESIKPMPNEVFFIDRNTGKNFKGMSDIYAIPKNTVSFGLAYVNKKGKILSSPFIHPEFDNEGKITLETLLNLSNTRNIMLQYEVTGTYINPVIKLGGFHFVR